MQRTKKSSHCWPQQQVSATALGQLLPSFPILFLHHHSQEVCEESRESPVYKHQASQRTLIFCTRSVTIVSSTHRCLERMKTHNVIQDSTPFLCAYAQSIRAMSLLAGWASQVKPSTKLPKNTSGGQRNGPRWLEAIPMAEGEAEKEELEKTIEKAPWPEGRRRKG